MLKHWENLLKVFFIFFPFRVNEISHVIHCLHRGFSHWVKWLKALVEKFVFPNPLHQNTFEEISGCAKYLGAILLITYLFHSVYDGTDSTLNNVNEYMKTEEWWIISLIKRVKCCSFWKKKNGAMCISGTILWCRDLFSRMKHKSLCISEREKFSALSQRLDLISVSTDGSVFWLSVCDTATLRIHLQNNWNCWLAIQSLSLRLLYCSLCIFPSSNLI